VAEATYARASDNIARYDPHGGFDETSHPHNHDSSRIDSIHTGRFLRSPGDTLWDVCDRRRTARPDIDFPPAPPGRYSPRRFHPEPKALTPAAPRTSGSCPDTKTCNPRTRPYCRFDADVARAIFEQQHPDEHFSAQWARDEWEHHHPVNAAHMKPSGETLDEFSARWESIHLPFDQLCAAVQRRDGEVAVARRRREQEDARLDRNKEVESMDWAETHTIVGHWGIRW